MSAPLKTVDLRRIGAIMSIAVLLPCLAAGCISDDGGNGTGPVTIFLEQPFMESRSTNAGNVWDATMDITKVLPADEEVDWVHVTVLIKDAFGSVLLPDTPVSKDGGLYGSAVEVWFVDDVGDANAADVGDAIKVTTMDQSYQGGLVIVNFMGSRAAAANLPLTFT